MREDEKEKQRSRRRAQAHGCLYEIEQTCREQLSNLQTQLETAKTEVQKPFPREAELNTKTARLEELNSLLNLDHKEPEIVDAEPDEDQRPPERRRPQLER